MTVVAHYVERWLELSAGFVAAHVRQSRQHGVVISRESWLNLDAFDHSPRHSLDGLRRRTPARVRHRVMQAQLLALLTAHRCDVVHVHFGYAAADVLGRGARRLPYVLSLHGDDVTGLLHRDPRHYDHVTGAVDAVVVPSRFLAARAVAAGFPEHLLSVVPAGVDTEFFTPTPLPTGGVPTVVFVGRLVAKKGVDVLLRAWPAVRQRLPDARLTILGSGPLQELLPIDDPSVTHLSPDPARRHEQVRDLLQAAALVVTPSRTAADGDSESLLLVNLEAAASGRPVVSTRHGGIPEYVVDGETGLLVPEADQAALARAMIRVLTDPGLAATLAGNARRHVLDLDVRRSTARIDDLYDELRAGRRRR